MVRQGPGERLPGMLQMVRTLAQFTIALDEMQENGDSLADDGGGHAGRGGSGEESDGNNGVTISPQNNTEVQLRCCLWLPPAQSSLVFISSADLL